MVKILACKIIFLTMLSLCSFAQNNSSIARKYSVWLGSRVLKVDSVQATNTIDFLNYAERQNRFMESYYVGFSGHFWLTEEWKFNMDAILWRGLIPKNFNISADYSLNRHLGINMGVYMYSVYFREFFTYHLMAHQTYILDTLHANNISSVYKDVGFVAGPVFSINHNQVSINLKVNGGVGSFLPFEESIVEKKTNSNERRRITYNGRVSPALLFMPEIELYLDLFKTKTATIGIQFQCNAIFSNRAIHYRRNTHTWLLTESVKETVKNQNHKYQMINLDAGVFWKFYQGH